ncbi:GNAT family N-acetyltransferase [Thalassobacillus hwangdonensis]|uniref:GNAT family N-acetyltransferase n=1 Tax=Thalassobacillus hwangdonensis TaxID=546108 RepID=A0ABW3L100_9BACI
MDIRLEALNETHESELLKFERENRDYFETMVPGRGEDYYLPHVFKERHMALLEEQQKGIGYYYLIKTASIIGRINLIVDGTIADLGYRLGEQYTGKGLATTALKQLMNELPPMLNEVHAKTTSTNIGSQKVLERNGFERVAEDEEAFWMNGEQVHFVYYVWKRGDQ